MKKVAYLPVVLFMVVMVACRQTEGDTADFQKSEFQSPDVTDEQAPLPPPEKGSIPLERKWIKEGTIEYKADNLADAKKALLQATARWKGYVANESAYNAADRISVTYTIKVPAVYFDSLLISATQGVSYFDRKDIMVKDVTEEFVDVEARLKTKKEMEQRYLQLLQKANTVTEMLEIEKELGVLRADIESIEGRLNVLKNDVAFSTLSVTIYETVGVPSFFGSRIGAGFVNGWNSLLDFFVFMVTLWPFLLAGVAGYVAIRRWRVHRKIK